MPLDHVLHALALLAVVPDEDDCRRELHFFFLRPDRLISRVAS
jgi:hypothetical protein